ncbi:hypothetical protein ACH5RR_009934 [Cinchona calisaya]|uniref:RBR-type E3 ubiquitin transferase n=1 Tax=Cinchona calisaya TaxID=153742 RepID=A0ABD3AI59_9GENT
MSWRIIGDIPNDDVRATAAEQRREIMAAKDIESDMDLAFHLQLEEAINASLSLLPSTSAATSPPPPPPPRDPVKSSHSSNNKNNISDLQSEELLKFEQEIKDRLLSEAEFQKIRDDLHRRIHDQKLAEEIDKMPEDEWEEFGNNFERPFGEGSSKNSVSNEVFRVYFKGLVEREITVIDKGKKCRFGNGVVSGIGVAICDSRGELLFEVKKPLSDNGTGRQTAEFKALLEGLNAALALELKRVVFYCDYYPIYQFVTGRWSPKSRKIVALVNQVTELRGRFTSCEPSLVARKDIQLAFKLAREALVSQVDRPAESSAERSLYETCVICFEDVSVGQIFSVDGCMHRYCHSCMKQHVEVKMLHGMVPKCPHESCDSELIIDSCSKFLTPKLVEIMKQRKKEASIPVAEKVYCPYPKCSTLMSKSEILEYSKGSYDIGERSGIRKCMKCNRLFCIDCKVPWHNRMSCVDYKRRNPNPPAEDLKLKTLAARNLWRQCVKCNHMIELAAGCYHMTCRCGYEFCYTCGAEWKNKKATCSCPLWDEDHIVYDSDSDEDEEFDEEDEEEYYESYSDDDYY